MLLISAALLLAAAPAGGQAQADQFLTYLVGTWGVVSVDPAGGDPLRVCYSVQPFVGDKWISGVAVSATPGFGSKDVWGVDGSTGELTRTIFDVSGTYAVVRSPGWADNALVLEGNALSSGGSMRVRETIRRVGPDEFTATWEAFRKDKWSAYAVETAKRVGKDECGLPS
jgi:hypothetical protein